MAGIIDILDSRVKEESETSGVYTRNNASHFGCREVLASIWPLLNWRTLISETGGPSRRAKKRGYTFLYCVPYRTSSGTEG